MSPSPLAPVEPLITNPDPTPPKWWYEDDETEERWRWAAPVPWTLQDCGCYLRNGDYEAVLCDHHLAVLNRLIEETP